MSRRTLRERIALRMSPGLLARANAGMLRIAPRRLRHAAIAEAVRLQYAAFTRADWDVILLFLDPEIELRTAQDAGHVFGADLEEVYRGHEGWRRYNELWLEPWDGVRVVADRVVDSRDCILVLGRVFARGRRSGVEVENPFATLSTVSRGRVTRMEVFLDWEDAMAAMEDRPAIPPPAAPG